MWPHSSGVKTAGRMKTSGRFRARTAGKPTSSGSSSSSSPAPRRRSAALAMIVPLLCGVVAAAVPAATVADQTLPEPARAHMMCSYESRDCRWHPPFTRWLLTITRRYIQPRANLDDKPDWRWILLPGECSTCDHRLAGTTAHSRTPRARTARSPLL